MAIPSGQAVIAAEAGKLAVIIPLPLMQVLAESINNCDLDDWPQSQSRIVQSLSHPHYRSLAAQFIHTWRAEAEAVTPQAVALALLTASQCERVYREKQSVEVVWTGPDIGVVPLRRTEQVLLQLIDSACERITVVSYAVYNIPRICDALVRAADRGVEINVIIETPDRLEGENTYNTLRALGPSVAGRCNVFLWPLEKRERDSSGKAGILHIKAAVADGRWLFLTSANLTQYAFTVNMELGVLITGGILPRQVEENFDRLIALRMLERV